MLDGHQPQYLYCFFIKFSLGNCFALHKNILMYRSRWVTTIVSTHLHLLSNDQKLIIRLESNKWNRQITQRHFDNLFNSNVNRVISSQKQLIHIPWGLTWAMVSISVTIK
jgi:hypothetical protein